MNRWMTHVPGIHPFIQPSQILEILAGTNTMQPTDCNQIMLDYLFLDWYFGEDWTKSKPFKGLKKTCQEYFSRTFSSFVQWVPCFFVQFCSSRKIPNCLCDALPTAYRHSYPNVIVRKLLDAKDPSDLWYSNKNINSWAQSCWNILLNFATEFDFIEKMSKSSK